MAGLARPCRSRAPAILWPPLDRVAGMSCCVAAPSITIQNCIATQAPTLRELLTVSRTLRSVSRALRRIVAHPAPYRRLYRCPYCDTNAAPSHDKILYRDTHPQRLGPRARAACSTRIAGLLVVSWPSRDALPAVSWPLLCAPMRLCHNTACCIVNQAQGNGH